MHRDEEIERSVGLQYEGKSGGRWKSVKNCIAERHKKGHQAFKNARRLKSHGAYVESNEGSPLILRPEELPRPRAICSWRIGWDQGEGTERESADWLWRKNECWNEEAMFLLGIKNGDFRSEWTWNWKEKSRAWYCVEFDSPYIRYP
jgi:hypothetical protein